MAPDIARRRDRSWAKAKTFRDSRMWMILREEHCAMSAVIGFHLGMRMGVLLLSVAFGCSSNQSLECDASMGDGSSTFSLKPPADDGSSTFILVKLLQMLFFIGLYPSRSSF